MGMNLEDAIELVKYYHVADWVKKGAGVYHADVNPISDAVDVMEEGALNQESVEIMRGACEAFFQTLSVLHYMGYDITEFNSIISE